MGQQALRRADQQAAGWRALMHLGAPEGATMVLVTVFALVFVTDATVFGGNLLLLAGNMPEYVRRGEWWRPATAMFLHANLLHLAMNGLALWLFGPAVERSLGRWRYLVIFLVAGSLGNLVSAMVTRFDVSVGASGGVFGVIGAFAVAAYRLKSAPYASVRRRLLWLMAAMVAIDLIISGLEPQVDNLAHAGGFMIGLALAAALYPRRLRHATQTLDAADSV
jgi:rhomboid protease GluP